MSLGELRRPEAVESLRQALDDEEWVQYAVMEALAKIKDGSCVDVLVHALDRCSPLVASTVLDGTGGDQQRQERSHAAFLSRQIPAAPCASMRLRPSSGFWGLNSLSLLGAKQLDQAAGLHAGGAG